MTHTPGLWETQKLRQTNQQCQQKGMLDPWRILSPKGEVAIIDGEADAKLIAAAPMLLEACELFAKWMVAGQPGPHSDSVVLEHARMAIELAKGKV